MMTEIRGSNRLVLALGANLRGLWGDPRHTLRRVAQELAARGLRVVCASHLYRTKPVGPGRQSDYLNAILIVEAQRAPAWILRLLKRLERRAGRRLGRTWGPRPLDIDILDYGGRRLGWPCRKRRGGLVIPHPEAHRRAFVLAPLAEIEPQWRHPVLGVTARVLLARLGWRARREAVQTLDSAASLCEKPRQ